MGSILKDYKKYQLELEQKYGPNSIVLMQIGSFYEIYSVDVENLKFGKTNEISKVLNILQTKKNKSLPHSVDNPYLAGFPVHSLGKHLLKLIHSSFTVALYNQFDGKKKKIRKLVQIYSPSTFLDEDLENSACMGINISQYKCPIQKKVIKECSIVIVDLSTGKNQLFTCGDTIDFPHKVEAELIRILASIRPSEIVHNCTDKNIINILNNYLIHFRIIDKKYSNIEYQKKFLAKLFTNKYDIEDLQLEKYPDLLSCYLFTLAFINEHDPRIITRIQKPTFLTSSTDVLLNNDALTQLNILKANNSNQSQFKSLLDIIDFTQTRMGYRLLKSRLFYPCKDIKILNHRYSLIDKMLEKKQYLIIQKQLQGIGDLEKKYRKLVLLRLKPYEFGRLSHSFEKISNILIGHELFSSFQKFFNDYNSTFDIKKMSNGEKLFFKHPIDIIIEHKHKNIKLVLKKLANSMSKLIDSNMTNLIRLESTEKDGFFLTTTHKRWSIFQEKLVQDKIFSIGNNIFNSNLFSTKKLSNSIRIIHPKFDQFWGHYKKLSNNLQILINKKYKKILKRYQYTFHSLFTNLISYLAELDVNASLAKASMKYNYVRPKIVPHKTSFIKAKKIRHPLIERIQDDKEYITNDIHIQNGILLYGVNAGGKSSLLRAIGANVILAQMGAFVACSQFEYNPFHHILTKIASIDNLFKGQSTFVYEMLELKHILSISNENSLILCDELTAGTETQSATGIVASSIQILLQKNVNFVFTTHLHGLINFPEITDNDKLRIYHFKILIKNNTINYQYTLKDGSGDSIYGIEIAKALGLSREFIKQALKFRVKISNSESNTILTNKRSRYNHKLIIDQCQNCGVKTNLQTHHIHEQHTANANGIIKHFHKNIRHNLQVLCETCHKNHHKK